MEGVELLSDFILRKFGRDYFGEIIYVNIFISGVGLRFDYFKVIYFVILCMEYFKIKLQIGEVGIFILKG